MLVGGLISTQSVRAEWVVKDLSSLLKYFAAIFLLLPLTGCQSVKPTNTSLAKIDQPEVVQAEVALDINRLLDNGISHIPCDNLLMFDVEKSDQGFALRVNLNGLFPIADGPSLAMAYRLADGKAQELWLHTNDPRSMIETDSRYFDRRSGDWVTRVQSKRSSRTYQLSLQQLKTLQQVEQLVAVVELKQGRLTRQCLTQRSVNQQAKLFGLAAGSALLGQSFNQGLQRFINYFVE
ncbi:hypothetical protein DC094_16655 [Pelagibaculum spongiae]|uniref:Uncharacterized protein n=2 Tax=Pelagibaculum spongiae TaxID=2080658 RepID=A0A2V1GUH7_9GAMM|nr:hypothetical protein DC094_16655 [Pelagibaculum spongiae]